MKLSLLLPLLLCAVSLGCAASATPAHRTHRHGHAHIPVNLPADTLSPTTPAVPVSRPAHGRHGAAHSAAGTPPNIVFVLTDDLSLDLLPYMPHVQAMERQGLTFDDYFVSDSLCCPSRSSIFTGDFPHDTGVYENAGPEGGFPAFLKNGDENHTFAGALQSAGYQTAMMGKYLNRYLQSPGIPNTYVPPGWSEWDVAGYGYPEYGYPMNVDGTIHHFGHAPSDYLTNVIAQRGVQFINRVTAAHQPFMLELATFAPHSPYVPAPQDLHKFPGLTAPEPPSFDTLPTNPPTWLAQHQPLTPGQIKNINRVFRKRAQSVQAVDRMIGRVEQTLQADGVAGNTYIVFSSDNGLHTGEYRLTPGKLTAFDTDIHVPLVIDGPGISPGTHTAAMTENIDLADTFSQLAGTTFDSDGHSLVPLFSNPDQTDWRDAVLVEHHGSDLTGSDPDYQQPSAGAPRTYEAMRTHDFLYVLYNDGEQEFYDLRSDPYELHNLAGTLTQADDQWLYSELAGIVSCHGGTACWTATHLSSPPDPLP